MTLAVLQYRWTGELSAAANQRMRSNLEESSRLLANDIDVPRAELHASFQRVGRRTAAAGEWLSTRDDSRPRRGGVAEPFETLLAQTVRAWRETATFPDLLDETWVVVTDRREGTRVVLRLDEEGGRLQPEPGPDYPDVLVRPLRPTNRLLPEVLADRVVVPVPARTPSGRPGPPTRLIVASIDLSVLEGEMLPALIERHFGAVSSGEEPPYLVSVTDVSGPAPRQVYPEPAGAPGAPEQAPPRMSGAADLEFMALRVRPLPERRDARDSRGGPYFRRPDRDDRLRLRLGERPPRGGAAAPGLSDGAWLVRITHRRGSLEAATAAARRRNLYMSSGALFLIGVAFALVLVSARRARSLATQQVDFVAGVSHELNTPLQAIRSAGENLRAGLVRESADIRGYGELIEREGRRLTRLVEQILQHAGIGRRSGPIRPEPLEPGELIHAVIEASRWFLEERRVELEVSGLDGLPPVRGDRAALHLALGNILHNAAKYGADEEDRVRARVEAGFDEARQRVTISVSDAGAGIPSAEQKRIFEPFVRGRRAVEEAVPGSGLGLSLARKTIDAHGGSIAVDSSPGRTTFTVCLPACGP